MKRLTTITVTLLLTLLLCGVASAQPHHTHSTSPQATKVWTKPFIALESAHAASAAFDSYTTVRNLSNGCQENNPLLGKHPSTAHIALFEAGWTAGEGVIAYELRKHHHPRIAALLIGESIVEHGVAGGLNTTQRCF